MAWIVDIDQYIIQVYNDNDIQLFSQNLVNIFLENSQSIRKAREHDLVFEVNISSFRHCFLFIASTNFHPIISICQIQMGELFDPTKLIQ